MRSRPLNMPLYSQVRRGNSIGATISFMFVLIAMPIFFLSGTMAIDVTKIIVSSRQASYIAHSSALAGAQEYLGQTAQLDPYRAEQAAKEFLIRQTTGNTRVTDLRIDGTPSVTVNDTKSEVTVAFSWRPSGMVMMPAFYGIVGSDVGTDQSLVYHAKESAFVCIPGQEEDPTAGYCRRPPPI